MAKPETATTTTDPTAAYRQAMDWMAGQPNGPLNATLRSVDVAMKHSTEIGREMAEFAILRFEDDLDTSRRMAACKNAGEVVNLQMELLQRLTQHYAEESQKLMRMMSAMSTACVDVYREQIDEQRRQAAE